MILNVKYKGIRIARIRINYLPKIQPLGIFEGKNNGLFLVLENVNKPFLAIGFKLSENNEIELEDLNIFTWPLYIKERKYKENSLLEYDAFKTDLSNFRSRLSTNRGEFRFSTIFNSKFKLRRNYFRADINFDSNRLFVDIISDKLPWFNEFVEVLPDYENETILREKGIFIDRNGDQIRINFDSKDFFGRLYLRNSIPHWSFELRSDFELNSNLSHHLEQLRNYNFEDDMVKMGLGTYCFSSDNVDYGKFLFAREIYLNRSKIRENYEFINQFIDGSILHTFEESKITESVESSVKDQLPVLIELKSNQKFDLDLEGFTKHSQLKNIVAASVSETVLKELIINDKIESIESSSEYTIQDSIEPNNFLGCNKVHDIFGKNEKGDSCIIAVIDTGVDIFHEAFKDESGRTRIIGLWDQNEESGTPPNEFDFGSYFSQKEIQELLDNNDTSYPRLRDPSGHGTHVASIALGTHMKEFTGGIAPKADLLVIIPKIRISENDPYSLGYSNSHVSALQFAESIALKNEKPIVVNVSLGMNAGAHDGTTLLETSFDLFTEIGKKKGRAIVKSAGNERGLRGHAQLVMNSYSKESIKWNSSSLHRVKDFIEIWFPNNGNFKFRLKPPTDPWSEYIDISRLRIRENTRIGNEYRITYTPFDKDNGDSRIIISIFKGKAIDIETGVWELEIESTFLNDPTTINAWIERKNNRPVSFINHINDDITLSIPSTAHSVISVSAIKSALPLELHPNSSFGPTRDGREKPVVCAPGIKIRGAKSNTFTDLIEMCGTSMASPHVAGVVALIFSWLHKNPDYFQVNSNQIIQLFKKSTVQNLPISGWTKGMGYGPFDANSIFEEIALTMKKEHSA